MKILDINNKTFQEVTIELIQMEDWEGIVSSNLFIFDWTLEQKKIIYKISIKSTNEIQGLVAIQDIPKEYRLHIHLIENSNPNKGRKKRYDYVAGCLIAYICQLAFEKDYEGFVSLEPKTELVTLYKDKYGFRTMGSLLYTALENSELLIKKYLNNE